MAPATRAPRSIEIKASESRRDARSYRAPQKRAQIIAAKKTRTSRTGTLHSKQPSGCGVSTAATLKSEFMERAMVLHLYAMVDESPQKMEKCKELEETKVKLKQVI